MGLSSSVGNASSFLYGIQAKRVSFNGPCAEVSGPQLAKPGLFSGEPVLFFTGVVTGTNKCRWHSVGGKGKTAQECSGPDVLVSVSGSSGMNELVAALSGAHPVVPTGETDSDGRKFEVLCSGSSGEDDLGSSMSEVPLPDVLNGTKSEVLHCENTYGGDVFEGLAGSNIKKCRRAPLGFQQLLHHHWWVVRVLCGLHSAPRRVPIVITVFASSFERCESHIAREFVGHVIWLSHPACDTGVHDAMQRVIRLGRNSGNSSNSWGDTRRRTSILCTWENKVTEYEYSV